MPGREDLDALIARLISRSLAFADDGRAVRLNDPWGTQVTVAVEASSTEETLER